MIHQVSAIHSLTSLLLSGGHRADIISGSRVPQAQSTLNPSAIDQIQLNYSSPRTRSNPREKNGMRVEQCLASLPGVRRSGMDIEIVQSAQVDWLRIRTSASISISIFREVLTVSEGPTNLLNSHNTSEEMLAASSLRPLRRALARRLIPNRPSSLGGG